jgi:hypothetical protein
MNTWRIAVPALILSLLIVACNRTSPPATPLAAPPQAGTLYSLSDGEGGFRAAKVISADAEVIFVNLYGNRWTTRPTLAAAQKAGFPAPIAFLTATFAGMQPVALQTGTVSADELEAYEAWKRSKQDAF